MNYINPENESADGIVTVASGTYTVSRKDSFIKCTGTCTIKFPAVLNTFGIKVFVKNVSASGTVTLDFSTNGSTCDGADSLTIDSQYGGMEVLNDGTAYFIRGTGNMSV